MLEMFIVMYQHDREMYLRHDDIMQRFNDTKAIAI